MSNFHAKLKGVRDGGGDLCKKPGIKTRPPPPPPPPPHTLPPHDITLNPRSKPELKKLKGATRKKTQTTKQHFDVIAILFAS